MRTSEGKSFVVADIPGLIEGAAEGAGLGHQFLRHLQRTRLLLHIVDIAPLDPAADPLADARAIVKELERYDVALAAKPRWLVLNKLDLVPEDERDARCKAFVRSFRWKGPVFGISAIDGSGCRELTFAIQAWLDAQPPAAPEAVDAERAGRRHAGARCSPSPSSARGRDMTPVASASRLVVKIGSSLVTNDGRGIDHVAVARWAAQIARLTQAGRSVVLVSSGAIAEGMQRLGWTTRPRAIHDLQAAAAVGQMGLVQAYETAFAQYGLHTAQVLLTHEDLSDRRRYLNARTTLTTLLGLRVIPVINENDTVTTDEIRFGDNDTLGALVTNLIDADVLVLLTDQQGLYTADPRTRSDGDHRRHRACRRPGARSDGGRRRQRDRPRRHADEGAGGEARRALRRIDDHRLRPGNGRADAPRRTAKRSARCSSRNTSALGARKQWLADHVRLAGRLTLDAGAVRALTQDGKSLLPVGVIAVSGSFGRGELVGCFAPDGREIARGLVNYGAQEAARIVRRPSSEIEAELGYVDEPELIHRDNLVLLG